MRSALHPTDDAICSSSPFQEARSQWFAWPAHECRALFESRMAATMMRFFRAGQARTEMKAIKSLEDLVTWPPRAGGPRLGPQRYLTARCLQDSIVVLAR